MRAVRPYQFLVLLPVRPAITLSMSGCSSDLGSLALEIMQPKWDFQFPESAYCGRLPPCQQQLSEVYSLWRSDQKSWVWNFNTAPREARGGGGRRYI